jgi:DNA-binding MarR family transcriptional regulator
MNESVNNDSSHLLLKQLSSAGHWANSRLGATLSSRGLSVAKLSVLRELCQASEPLALGQLAERLNCGKSNVTQLVDRLEHEGLVRRVPHPDDRRCMHAAVTEEGRRRCEWGLQAESEVEQQLFRNLSEPEKEQLVSLLGEIHLDTNLNAESERVELRS